MFNAIVLTLSRYKSFERCQGRLGKALGSSPIKSEKPLAPAAACRMHSRAPREIVYRDGEHKPVPGPPIVLFKNQYNTFSVVVGRQLIAAQQFPCDATVYYVIANPLFRILNGQHGGKLCVRHILSPSRFKFPLGIAEE